MATVYLTVHAVVGEPRTGYWCPRCLLPSAAEFDLTGLHSRGVVQLGPLRACPECGWRSEPLWATTPTS